MTQFILIEISNFQRSHQTDSIEFRDLIFCSDYDFNPRHFIQAFYGVYMIMANIKGLQFFKILKYLYRLDMIIRQIYFPSIGEIGNKGVQRKYI